MKKASLFLLICLLSVKTFAQGNLSGDLMMNLNFFQRDTSINATGPLYDKVLSGGEAWLSLRYSYKGFNAFLRLDAFHNSNLLYPNRPTTAFGVGAWSLSKEFHKLTVTGGYIYDQIGTGIIFRAYEDRGLLIDNALVGVHVKYQANDHILLKAFTGQQKNIVNFGRLEPIIKGLNGEGDYQLGETVHIVPGIGVVNRTIDETAINTLASSINTQDITTRFVPRYNTYAFTAYNTLTAGDFSWYAEGAYKTHEAIYKDNIYQDLSGNVEYTTLGFARKGIAINLTGKRTENFALRNSPLRLSTDELAARSVFNWQPVVARIRPQRLLARYTPASQDLSELALGSDLLLSPSDNLDVTLNYTHINTLGDTTLYREVYGEVNYRGLKKWILQAGVQYLRYNQDLYQAKPGAPMVEAITPFVEAIYKIDDKKSIRTEWEYMHTEQDYGSWLFGLLEFNIAPKWSFAVSDMYTLDLNPDNLSGLTEPQHYYSVFMAHTHGPHRFTAAYVRQVDGINCTGGVCRYEPAFSGLKFTLTSSF